MSQLIPKGFARHDRRSPVTEPWEPIYARRTGDVIELGLVLSDAHCNSRGFAHGGVLAALADNAMGLSCGATLRLSDPEAVSSALTVTLSVDYVASARKDAWLLISPRVLRAGGTLGFADALVTANGCLVARATATFKLLSPTSAVRLAPEDQPLPCPSEI